MLQAFTGKVLLLFLSLWEIWMYYQFLYATCIEKTQLLKWQRVVMQISIWSIGILFAINRNILFFSHVMFLLGIIYLILILWMVEKKDFIFLASITIIYFSSVALLDFFFAFLGMCMIEDMFAENIYFSGHQIEKIVIYFCSRSCVACILNGIKKYGAEKSIDRFKYIFLVIGVFFSILVRGYQVIISDMAMGRRELQGSKSLVSMSVVIAVLIFLMILWVKNRILQEENNTLVMEEQLQHQKYCEMVEVMEQNRELIHDTKHHFLVVQEYLKNEEYENLQKYIKQISDEFQRTVPKVYTGIKILDFILEQKRVVAQKSGIRYEIDTMLLTGIPTTEQETCALFGNLLDNAIEACCLVETEEKWIEIQINQRNQLLSIEVLNTFEIPCIRKQGVFETIKEERSVHGYGIKSMRRIVDKHQGLITYEEKEKIFITKITFFNV
ncbi:sensor histidine kinase [Mediterraneibacter gnavus]|uniref:sensor histidine kinase n=1 Tax=Mediterraneibacter gnavus TaxID=33038 RepID=UPI00321AB0B7